MHTSVIRSPQAMSNDQSYRPRSPNLSGLAEAQPPQELRNPPPRLTRLPSYQIQEPSLPKGYSFSPRGSYDASPFFTQPSQQGPNNYLNLQPSNSYTEHSQSPPRFLPATLPDQPQVYSPVSYSESGPKPPPPPSAGPFSNSTYQFPHHQHTPSHQQYHDQQQQHHFDEMARLRSRRPVNYNEDHDGSQPQYDESMQNYLAHQNIQQHVQQPPQPHPMQVHQQFMQQPLPLTNPLPPSHAQTVMPTSTPLPAVDVRTKFPVARIKRIMQADEDVGKVAQATPTAVSKALEMFMIALVTKGASEAKANNSKRVTATHLKHALLTDPQFDFLNEICESVPDEGGKGSKGRAKSEAKSEDSDEEMMGMPKKKSKASRKKKAADADGFASD